MKFKKLAAMAVAGVLVAASLTSCGTTTNTDTTDNAESASAEKYTIGISQFVQHPALDAATKGFKDVLTEKLGDNVEFDEQNAAGDAANSPIIANQFVSKNVDLIFANATPALTAAATATDTIPIVGTSVTSYSVALDIDDWTGTTGTNVTGTADLAPLEEQAALFKELLPDVKKIGMLYCSGEPNSLYQVDVITEELEKLGYECANYAFADTNDVAAVTTKACSECDALYIPTDNTAASNTEAINNIAMPAKTPIIAGEEGICEGCGIATLSISYESLGRKAGEMAYDILVNGADPAAMEIQYDDNLDKKYVKERCEAYGITVPDDYLEIGA